MVVHILYIHQHFATNDNAGGTRSYDYARYLVKAGHRVTVLSGRYASSVGRNGIFPKLLECSSVENIDIISVGIPYANRMSYINRVASFISFSTVSSIFSLLLPGIDVIYATSTPLTVGIPALAARILRGRRYVFEVRDLWPEVPVALGVLKNPLLIRTVKIAEHLFYRYAEIIVSISRGINDRLETDGVSNEKTAVIYTGVDLDLYDSTESDRGFLAGLGIKDHFIVVYAGAISTVNRVDYILDVAKILRNEEKITFLIVGDGRDRSRLEDNGKTLGLSNTVFTGPIPKRKLVGILKACHVGINSVLPMDVFRPVMPNKLFDYLAAGLPVLSNHPAELTSHLEEYGCGYEVSSDEPGEMAQRILELMDNPEMQKRMSRKARTLAEDRFDRKKLATELNNIIICATMSSTDVPR